eukprot:Rmarinus@m.6522
MPVRRGVGVGAIHQRTLQQKKFQAKGEEMLEVELKKMQDQLAVFKENLEEFASKHKKDIGRNPQFRAQFNHLCAKIGVDPLASKKGFWSDLLGVGDFYYELAVQAVEVCLTMRPKTGGLIECSHLRAILERTRGPRAQPITDDDMERAVQHVALLGGGFAIRQIGKKKFVQSVPGEINPDQSFIVEVAEENGGRFTSSLLRQKYSWDEDRFDHALEFLLQEGIVWVDLQAAEKQYWCLSMIPTGAVGLAEDAGAAAGASVV